MDITKITMSQYEKALETKRNILVLGTSGIGKTKKVYDYATKYGLKVLDYDLAGRLSEEVAGIPAVKGDYYTRTLDHELEDFFACKGDGYILFFDEINQGQPDVLNTLYRITHPDPSMRKWAGHDISKCQIVACGNMSDGSDGTVYLTELPTPLLNRFFVFQLVADNKETMDYLRKKYKNMPEAVKYIKVMQEERISPRDIDLALDILQFDADGIFLESKLGAGLTAKLYDIQKDIKSKDPAETLKNAKLIYQHFKEAQASGDDFQFGMEIITTEEELKDRLLGFLSEEEVTAVMKGDE